MVATMSNETRKADIRRRLALSRYPRRAKAIFTDENDHNPLVLQDCRACRGSGKQCHHGSQDDIQVYSLERCNECGGLGVTGQVEPFFSNNELEMSAYPDSEGWLTCPACQWRFTIHDRRAWTGRRHMRCGQKIKVIEERPPDPSLLHGGCDKPSVP
jgi:hypothetical protein